MLDLEVAKTAFKNNYAFNVKELFSNSFGANKGDKKLQIVKLLFAYEQGQYVKNFPLHSSQKEFEDGESIRIVLTLFISYDFIMELLSFGDQVKIISPASLKNKVKIILKKTLNQYN